MAELIVLLIYLLLIVVGIGLLALFCMTLITVLYQFASGIIPVVVIVMIAAGAAAGLYISLKNTLKAFRDTYGI